MPNGFLSMCSNPNSATIRILHVDDEPEDLEITRIFLKRVWRENFEIVSVLSVREALEKLESEHFDVVISDYQMPDMNGIEFLEVVRKSEKYADTPFIIFTGRGGEEIAKDALNRGADGYIDKMGNPARQCNELARVINESVMERRRKWVTREERDSDKRRSTYAF